MTWSLLNKFFQKEFCLFKVLPFDNVRQARCRQLVSDYSISLQFQKYLLHCLGNKHIQKGWILHADSSNGSNHGEHEQQNFLLICLLGWSSFVKLFLAFKQQKTGAINTNSLRALIAEVIVGHLDGRYSRYKKLCFPFFTTQKKPGGKFAKNEWRFNATFQVF